MSAAGRPSLSGLTPLELAVLRAVEACGGAPDGAHVPTTEVLERVDAETGVGPRYSNQLVADLIATWVRHLPLLDGDGNFGSIGGDSAAEARYTRVRLAPVGELALAAERGEVGPLPLDLIEGSLYRGGRLPPFDPALTVRALLLGTGDAGVPRTPTGTISIAAAADPLRRDGRWLQRYQLGSVIRTGGRSHELVLTEPPFRVPTDTIAANLRWRIEQGRRRTKTPDFTADYLGPSVVPPAVVPLRDAVDLSSWRTGTWISLTLKKGFDVVDALDWVRSVWPVTVHVDCASHEETYDRFAVWRGLDTSGVRALAGLLGSADG